MGKKNVNKSDVIAALEGTADLLQKGWTRDALARDSEGNKLNNVKSKKAVCFCAIGGLERTCSVKAVRVKAVRVEAIRALNERLHPNFRAMPEEEIDYDTSEVTMVPANDVDCADALINYNDSEFRKKSEVVKKFRSTAERLRQGD